MPHGIEICGALEIGSKALLAAVYGVKQRRVPADLGIGEIETPAKIAAVRPLDLDDARAEIAEPQRGEGADRNCAIAEHEQAV